MFQGLQESQLAGAIEAMLFVTDEPVGVITLADMLEVDPAQVEAALVELRDKLAAQKTISRAKCMLIQQGMSEQDAHKELEKRAMESRRTLLDVASDITEKGGTRIFVPSDERKTEE